MDLALLAGILIVANVLAFRYGGQPMDMTSEGAVFADQAETSTSSRRWIGR